MISSHFLDIYDLIVPGGLYVSTYNKLSFTGNLNIENRRSVLTKIYTYQFVYSGDDEDVFAILVPSIYALPIVLDRHKKE